MSLSHLPSFLITFQARKKNWPALPHPKSPNCSGCHPPLSCLLFHKSGLLHIHIVLAGGSQFLILLYHLLKDLNTPSSGAVAPVITNRTSKQPVKKWWAKILCIKSKLVFFYTGHTLPIWEGVGTAAGAVFPRPNRIIYEGWESYCV